MKVLLLIHELGISGAPKLTLTLLKPLKDLHVWTIAIRSGELSPEFERLGRVTVLTRRRLSGSKVLIRILDPLLEWRIRRWRPDVIYASTVAALYIPANFALPSAPAILHVHEVGSALREHLRGFANWFRNWPQKFIAVTETVRAELIGELGISPEQVVLIPACLSEFEFDRARNIAIESRYGVPREEHPFVVCGAGRTGWVKGLLLWLLMATKLRERLQDRVRFRWIGIDDGQASQNFKAMARKLGVFDLIEFVPVTRDPLPYLRSCHVFAMTSWEESASLVTLESMMCEVPVVCFRGSGGPVELLAETGIIIESFDPYTMAEAIISLAHNPEKRKQLGGVARKRVAAYYLAEGASAQLERILRGSSSSFANAFSRQSVAPAASKLD